MRVALVALVGLSLASCGRSAEKRLGRNSLASGLQTDMHGRAYLQPTRTHPDILMQAGNPVAAGTTAAGVPSVIPAGDMNSTSNLGSVATPPALNTLFNLSSGDSNFTGRAALNQISARANQGKVSSVRIENGKSVTELKYNDGSEGIVTTGDGTTEYQFSPSATPTLP